MAQRASRKLVSLGNLAKQFPPVMLRLKLDHELASRWEEGHVAAAQLWRTSPSASTSHVCGTKTSNEYDLQRTDDEKVAKNRMHLDLESDDVVTEVQRLEALGATRWDHQQERGYDFWVMRDPWGNEFCVLQPEFSELLARQAPLVLRS